MGLLAKLFGFGGENVCCQSTANQKILFNNGGVKVVISLDEGSEGNRVGVLVATNSTDKIATVNVDMKQFEFIPSTFHLCGEGMDDGLIVVAGNGVLQITIGQHMSYNDIVVVDIFKTPPVS